MASQLSALDRSMAVGSADLSFQNLHKSFGPRVVLHDIHLDIVAGEFVAIVGKSGSGKSTLLRLAAGLEIPTAGEVLVSRTPLHGLNKEARMMFQEARLLPWKRVLDNVALGLSDNARTRAAESLRAVGLEERARDWPAVLSGGQRQRVALARALASHPRLLLLDEPLGALDALTRLEMQALVEELWRANGWTALLVTHDVDEAVALADRVVLIEDGGIVLDQPIPLPRPRDRADREFVRLREAILARVKGETRYDN